MKNRIVLLLAFLSVLVTVTADAAEFYERKVLFSVRYGTGAGDIRMAEDEYAILRGPSTFAVGAKGEVLIGSRASRLVKTFSPEGKLLGMIACDAWHLAPEPEGGFYALADYRNEEGERRGLRVAKYDSHGKLLYSLFPDFFASVLGNDVDAAWPKGIETDSSGNLYCVFRNKTAKFNSSGKFLNTFPSPPYFNMKHERYEFSPGFAAPGSRIGVKRLSADGKQIGSTGIKINKPEMKKGDQLYLSFYEEEATSKGLGANWVDDTGNIYLAGVIESREPVLLMEGALRIPGRHVIQKYSPDGKFLTEIQFMAEPTGDFPTFEITRK